MNKVMLYVGLAILLGTVTMIAPLAVLEPSSTLFLIEHDLLATPGVCSYNSRDDGTKRSEVRGNSVSGDKRPDAGNYSGQADNVDET